MVKAVLGHTGSTEAELSVKIPNQRQPFHISDSFRVILLSSTHLRRTLRFQKGKHFTSAATSMGWQPAAPLCSQQNYQHEYLKLVKTWAVCLSTQAIWLAEKNIILSEWKASRRMIPTNKMCKISAEQQLFSKRLTPGSPLKPQWPNPFPHHRRWTKILFLEGLPHQCHFSLLQLWS